MALHYVCLTIDTDPDGLSGPLADRHTLVWRGLEVAIAELVPRLRSAGIAVTWFVRADGQLRDRMGTALYLLERYAPFWDAARARGDEIGWHPHLYRQPNPDHPPQLISEPQAACDELQRLWADLQGMPFAWRAFRNGEGWHTPETLRCIESFGIAYDSTAIPGRDDSPSHPRNWDGAPNQPYYPSQVDIRRHGPPRPLLEVPMTTWLVQAPYDRAPRLRYMNPTLHRPLFASALRRWLNELAIARDDRWLWTFILHPDDAMPIATPDALYAHDPKVVLDNLRAFQQALTTRGHTVIFLTLSAAADQWRALPDGGSL